MTLEGVGQKTLVALTRISLSRHRIVAGRNLSGTPMSVGAFTPPKIRGRPGEMQFIDCPDFEECSKQSRSALANECAHLVVAAQDLQHCREIDFGRIEDPEIGSLGDRRARNSSDIPALEKTRIGAPGV